MSTWGLWLTAVIRSDLLGKYYFHVIVIPFKKNLIEANTFVNFIVKNLISSWYFLIKIYGVWKL